MKTKLLSLFAVLLLTQGLMAQFHIGAKGGANIIKVEGKSFDQAFRYGYHAGGFAEIGLGRNLGIQPEVIFNQYSTRVDSNFNHVYQNVFNQGDVKLNYLSIPILLSYKLFGNFLSLQAGPHGCHQLLRPVGLGQETRARDALQAAPEKFLAVSARKEHLQVRGMLAQFLRELEA